MRSQLYHIPLDRLRSFGFRSNFYHHTDYHCTPQVSPRFSWFHFSHLPLRVCSISLPIRSCCSHALSLFNHLHQCFFPLDSEDVSRYILAPDDPRLATLTPRKRRREATTPLPAGAPTPARQKKRRTASTHHRRASTETPQALPLAPQLPPQPRPAPVADSIDIDNLLIELLDFDDSSLSPQYQMSFSPAGQDASATVPPSGSGNADATAITYSEDALREFLFFDAGGADANNINASSAFNLDALLADELAAVNSPPSDADGRPGSPARAGGSASSCDEASSRRPPSASTAAASCSSADLEGSTTWTSAAASLDESGRDAAEQHQHQHQQQALMMGRSERRGGEEAFLSASSLVRL